MFNDHFYVALILICLLVSCTGEPNHRAEEDITIPLTEGTNMALALSPDKQSIALSLQGTIWLLPVGGGEATPITGPLNDCQEPAWSPDGQQIAFHSYTHNNYHIWTIKKDGAGLQQLTTGVFDDREPTWSPDGKRILFSSDRNGNYDLWEVDLHSKATRPLTFHPSNEYHPVFSPDGKSIAFVSEHPDKPGIHVMGSQGGESQLLVTSKATLAAPSWDISQKKITFAGFNGPHSQMMLKILDDPGPAKALTQGQDVFPFRTAWLDGNSFLYTGDGKVKRYRLPDGKIEEIPFEATVTLHRPDYKRKTYHFNDTSARTPLGIMNPVVAPDGQSVAFTALSDLWVQFLEKDSLTAITDDPYMDIDPAWSPDGGHIAFVSDREGSMDLWVSDLSSGRLEQLTDVPQIAGFPSWSPDGQRIAFFLRDYRNVWGSAALYIIDLKTRGMTELPGKYFVPGKPSWSPDGQQIAFLALQPFSSRYREGISQFLFVSVKDGRQRSVIPPRNRTPSIRNASGPVWSPNGQYMTYVQDGLLWKIAVDKQGNFTGEPKALTTELASAPSCTSDGDTIVYLATDQLKKLELESGKVSEIPIHLSWKPRIGQGRYVIHAGRLFDGLQNAYRKNVDIVINDNRIEEISTHRERPGLPLVDASDKTIIPGLFESHSHAHASVGEKLGRIWLAYGITSVREPGADPYDALERKEAWASGRRPGPREFFTGGLTDGSRIYYGLANSVVNSTHLNLELERAKRLDYDLIKTYVRMPDSLQKVIIEAAHNLGIPVSSHEIYPAAKFNADATEHTSGTSRRGYSPKQTYQRKMYNDVIQLLVHSQMFITPTIGLQGGFFIMAARDSTILQNTQYLALYSKDYRRELDSRVKASVQNQPAYWQNFENIQASVTKIVRQGGRMTAGTDVPFVPFGHSLHVELQLYVDGGLTPFQALQSATLRAAESVGVAKDLGSIEEGKLADLVIVEGDPLNNIRDAWNVVMTVKDGLRFDVEELLQKPQ